MATNTLNFSTLVVQVSSSESHLLGCKILPPNTLTPLCSPLDQRWAMKLYSPLSSARQLGQPCLSCCLLLVGSAGGKMCRFEKNGRGGGRGANRASDDSRLKKIHRASGNIF